jgi:hypothetical protein
MSNKKLGVFLYNRLFDPVIQSNFWLYINDYLKSDEEISIYLITYEDSKFPLTDEQFQLVEQWKLLGLEWIPLKWSPGVGIISKTKDILQGFLAVMKCRLKGCGHFVSLASIAGAYLYLYYLVLRFDYYLYQYEPHSEYAIDNRMWNKSSVQYLVAHFLERKSAMRAKVISSGTRFMKHRLTEEWKVKAKFFKIPSVANDTKFLFSQKNRDEIRTRFGFLENSKVLFYPGKFGDLYYREEIAFMFKWIQETDVDFHFLIVTPQADEEVIRIFESANVARSTYTIAHSDYSEIHKYFAAADFAVIAVPPGSSKKFISNIKVGEYLTAGLPYLITEGISEDYLFARERKVGVVVKDFNEECIKNAYSEINDFLKMDKEKLRAHCRTAGIEYRGFTRLNQTFREAISTLYH